MSATAYEEAGGPAFRVFCEGRGCSLVSITLLQLGLGLALNNLWITLLSPVSLLVVHFLAVVPEEKYLSEKLETVTQPT